MKIPCIPILLSSILFGVSCTTSINDRTKAQALSPSDIISEENVILSGRDYPTDLDHVHSGPADGPTQKPAGTFTPRDAEIWQHAEDMASGAGPMRKLVIDGGKPYQIQMKRAVLIKMKDGSSRVDIRPDGQIVTRRANLRPIISTGEAWNRILTKQGIYTGRIRIHTDSSKPLYKHGVRERIYWDTQAQKWSAAYEGSSSPTNYYFWKRIYQEIIGDTQENNDVIAYCFPGRFKHKFTPGLTTPNWAKPQFSMMRPPASMKSIMSGVPIKPRKINQRRGVPHGKRLIW